MDYNTNFDNNSVESVYSHNTSCILVWINNNLNVISISTTYCSTTQRGISFWVLFCLSSHFCNQFSVFVPFFMRSVWWDVNFSIVFRSSQLLCLNQNLVHCVRVSKQNFNWSEVLIWNHANSNSFKTWFCPRSYRSNLLNFLLPVQKQQRFLIDLHH